jgi:hypothetical protein
MISSFNYDGHKKFQTTLANLRFKKNKIKNKYWIYQSNIYLINVILLLKLLSSTLKQ